MEAPIYIHFSFFPDDRDSHQKTCIPPPKACIQNQLIVVDDAAADSRVRILNLPDLGRYSFLNSGLAVAKSRLFLVGGSDSDYSGGVKFNGILSVNFDGGTSWETNPLGDDPEEFCYIGGTAVSDDGNLIYGIGLQGRVLILLPAYSFVSTV